MATPDINVRIPASTAELLDRFAQRIGITLEEFWKEIEDHFVKHPGSELSEYLVGLSNDLEGGVITEFSPRIRQAAILIQTLQGRLLLAQQHTDAHEKGEGTYYEIARERGETIARQVQLIQKLEAQVTQLENARDILEQERSYLQGLTTSLYKDGANQGDGTTPQPKSDFHLEFNEPSDLKVELATLSQRYNQQQAATERLRRILFHARPALLAELLCPTNPHT